MKFLYIFILLLDVPVFANNVDLCALAIASDKSHEVTFTLAKALAAFDANTTYLTGKVRDLKIKIAEANNTNERLKLEFTQETNGDSPNDQFMDSLIDEGKKVREENEKSQQTLALTSTKLAASVQLQLSLLRTITDRLAMHKAEQVEQQDMAPTTDILHARYTAISKRRLNLVDQCGEYMRRRTTYENLIGDAQEEILSYQGRQVVTPARLSRNEYEGGLAKLEILLQSARAEIMLIEQESQIIRNILTLYR